MVDDLGFNDLSINNNASNNTPKLDQLAQQGVRFTRHYAYPVCSPARAALLTGQYPERFGFFPNGREIPENTLTLAEHLAANGYSTWHIGKWHLGDTTRQAWPDRQGFQHWLGFLNQWRLAGEHHEGTFKLTKPRYFNPWLQGDSEPGKHFQGHLDDILTAEAITAITTMHSQQAPWFLNLWYYAPHTPIQPANSSAQLYEDSPAGRYQALVHQLDNNIGKVLDHLNKLGVGDNTIVIVVSDNGGTNRQLDNNAPFFGTKNSLYEGGLRTPLIIRWSDHKKNKLIREDIVSILDIFPTINDALGLEQPQHLDGNSFYHGEVTPRHLFWNHGDSYSLLTADGRWRLYRTSSIFGNEAQTLLFDLANNPHGGSPVNTPPENLLSSLKQTYRHWHKDVHTIPLQLTRKKDGWYRVSSASTLHSPGFGSYTFAMPFDSNHQGLLAYQQQAWEFNRVENKLVARFGDITLEGVMPDSRDCHSIAISGQFYRSISSFSNFDSFVLDLYIDGQKVDEGKANGILNQSSLNSPIMLRMSQAWFGTPVILNTSLLHDDKITSSDIHKRVCQNSSQLPAS